MSTFQQESWNSPPTHLRSTVGFVGFWTGSKMPGQVFLHGSKVDLCSDALWLVVKCSQGFASCSLPCQNSASQLGKYAQFNNYLRYICIGSPSLHWHADHFTWPWPLGSETLLICFYKWCCSGGCWYWSGISRESDILTVSLYLISLEIHSSEHSSYFQSQEKCITGL